jgi:hypothetical protein
MRFLKVLIAALVFSSPALAQTGTVTNHAFALGKGAGSTGYTSLLCTSAQLAVGQAAADPICQTISGDVTISAGGVTAIGATKVTSSMLNADVFSTAHSWAGQQTFTAPVLGTPASGTLTNATGLPVATGISGLATGVSTFLATPSSANLRAALTDEVGTGAAYFVGGALGTPASGTATNLTGLPLTTGVTGNLPNANLATMATNTVKGNGTSGTATPTDLAVPSCSTATSALTWTTNTGFGCNTIAGGGGGTPPLPGGRLTPSSGVCAPVTDVVAATAIFYAPCGTPYVPIYNGSVIQAYNYTSGVTDAVGLTLTLGSNWAASTLYDVFITLNAGNPVECTVAWTSSVAGTSSRATALSLYGGFLTNATLATCRISNAATISMAANQGTWVGTFMTSASAGQVDLKFGTAAAGGGVAFASIYNAYNQVRGSFTVQDSNGSWNQAASGFEVMDPTSTGSGLNNRINVVAGSTSNAIDATVGISVSPTLNTNAYIGIALNGTSQYWSKCEVGLASSVGAVMLHNIFSRCSGFIPVGNNYLQVLEGATSLTTAWTSNQTPQISAFTATWWW